MPRNKLKTLIPFTVAAYVLLALILLPPIMTLVTYAETAVSPQPVNPNPVQQPPSEPTTPPSPNSPIVVPNNPKEHGSNTPQVVIVPPSTPSTNSNTGSESEKPHTHLSPIQPTLIQKAVLMNKTYANTKNFENYKVAHLITGDVVFFTKVNGKYAVSVKPAVPGEKFYTLISGEHLYVIPAGVDLKKFDISLFDVTYLAKYYSRLSKLPIIVELGKTAQLPPAVILRKYVKDIPGAHGTAFTIIRGFSMEIPISKLHKAFTMLSSDPTVRKVVLDKVFKVASEPISAADIRAALYDSTRLVGATYSWSLGINGTGIKVAILDTGIDPTHPDFYFPNGTSKIIANRSFVDFNFDGVPDENITDGFGHGTHCAGIIAGTGRASNGSIKGVAPGAVLLVGKVLSNEGWGYESWIINGIQWAVEEGANIISMSLGGPASTGYDPLEDAVKNATEQGVLVVIAAGNEGPNFFTIGSPGTTPQALTVAAVDKNLNPAWFTSVGPTVKLQMKPDIAAPGVMIASARANNTFMGPPASKYYVFASGTSMATPHVAGLAALVEEAIKARENALGQQIPMSPEDIKYMLMSYAQPLPYSPLQVGAGFANVTTLINALMNTSKYVIYVEPQNTTVYGESGIQNITFTIKIIPGTAMLNNTLELSIGPGIVPWPGSYVNMTYAIVGVTPSFASITISNVSQVITIPVQVAINWSAIGAGFHTIFLYVKSALNLTGATNTTIPQVTVVSGMAGLFKLQHMTVTVTTTNDMLKGTSGIVAIVPEFPCSDSVPQVFQFDELPVTINVPVVIPGVTYDIGVEASSSNLLVTTAYNGNTYTDPSKTDFNFTIDLDQQLSSGFIKEMYLNYPFTSPGISTPMFVASELIVNRTVLMEYAFSNYVEIVTVPSTNTAQYPEGIFVIDPALTVIWPDNSGNLRIYEALHQLPESTNYGDISGAVFSAEPNFKAQVILRTIGDQLVYIPLDLIVYKFPAISAQYGFLTPKVINVLIYCNSPEEVQGLYTPAYIYVQDSSGNEIGYVVFDNTFLDYGIFYGSNVTETDPLRMPYGTTVWLSDVTAWKGIDAQDYIVGEEYVRFLDSWWDTHGALSAYTILYINGKEVLVSPDDDPGVYTYGWASIGNASVAKVLFDSHATLSWAGSYVYFMKDMSVGYNVTIENLPTTLSAGVPAYPIVDAFYLDIPGYGVKYIEVDPLTLSNIVPKNLTSTGNITMIVGVPEINNVAAELEGITVKVFNASGYPVLTANITGVMQIDPSNYFVQAQFSLADLPVGDYGVEVIVNSMYNLTSNIVRVSYDFKSYPAIKVEPLVLKPIYVGYEPYCNFTSIQEAINYAYPNQTIYVLPGTYFIDKPIVINKPVKIIGVIINGSEPVINMTAWGSSVVTIGDTGIVELANLTIFANNYVDSIIDGTNLYGLTLSNIQLLSKVPGDGIDLFNVRNISLKGISIEVLNPEDFGFTGIYVSNNLLQPTSLSLNNVQISYQFMMPVWIDANPEYTTLKYENVNVVEEGVPVPLTIYKYANAGSVNIVPASRYVFILASNTSVTLSDAKLEWVSARAGINHATITLSNIEFLNRTYPTRIVLNAEEVTLEGVKYLQPLANGVDTKSSMIMLESLYSVVNNSVLSNLWILGGSTSVYNSVIHVPLNCFGIYDRYVDELIVQNVSFEGSSVTSKGTLGIYVMEVTSPSAMIKITDSSFTNLVYGVVLPSGMGMQVIKDNTFVDVDIPVTLLPPGSTPSWLAIVFGSNTAKWVDGFKPSFLSEESSLPSNITSRELIVGASSSNSSKVLIYSNTFQGFRTGINATNLRRSVVMMVNNTFTPLTAGYPTNYLVLMNASLIGLWLNVFNPAQTTYLTLGSNVTYVNYNNFLTSNVVLNTSSTYLLDMRWNYLQCQSGAQCSIGVIGNPQYVRSSSIYGTPLALPLKHLIPVVLLSGEGVPSTSTNYVVYVTQGASTNVRLDFINPYDQNITYSYSIEPAPGINVSDHELEGNKVLSPVYVNSSEENVSFSVKGESPGTSAIYVNVDDFRYTYPVRVLPVTVRLSVTAPSTVLRGAKIPVTINVTSENASISTATLMVTLSNGLEVVDPLTYRGASTIVLPVTFNGSSALIHLNLTDIKVGNATMEVYVYVLGESAPVNYTSKTITVVPNPNVRFNVTTYLGDNVTVNRFTYLEVRIDGDPNYSLLLNVTVRTLNKDVLALGYDGNETSYTQVVRTDPYARIAYVYVPVEGVSVGNATVEVSVTSVGDGVTRTLSRTIKVNPLTDWGFLNNITVVNNEDNVSEMSLKYPNTTLRAQIYLIVYSSKVSVSYEALKNLMSVPWGCVEQTTSPLLSDIEVYKYITQRNLWSAVTSINKTLLEDYIRSGVDRLLNHHLSCNATNCWFGWYPGLEATKFFTIYGTLGLLRAYEFAYVEYRNWYGTTFDLGVNVQQLNESIAKLLKTIVNMRNPQGYWSYPPDQVDYISDDIPLTAMAVYVLSKAVSLGYLPANMSREQTINVIQQAVNWLESQELSSGGWAPDSDESVPCPYATAYVLRALALASNVSIGVNATVIAKAVEFLNASAKGGDSFAYWEPEVWEWNSFWGMDKYLTTAEAVEALAELNSTSIASTLPQTTLSLINNLSMEGAKFLILTASEWVNTWNTYEGSAILMALNSVAADLTFTQPPTVQVTVLLNGRTPIFNKNYTLANKYSLFSDTINLNSSLLSQGKTYVIRASLISGEGEVVVVAYSDYEYVVTSATTSPTMRTPSIGLAKESRHLMNSETTIVVHGKVYRIEQSSTPATATGTPGIKVTQSATPQYVARGMPVKVTIEIKPVNTSSLFGVVVTERIPTGFEAVVNLSLLGSNVAFDEDRFNKSGGTVIRRTATTLTLSGGKLAFAIQTVPESGVKIQYTLIPVNVSEGRVTLPEVDAWMFYSPLGRRIGSTLTATPSINIGMPFTVSPVSEVIMKGVTLGNNSVLKWGDKVDLIVNTPSTVNVSLIVELVSNGTTYMNVTRSNCRGTTSVSIDTLSLYKHVSTLSNSYVDLVIKVVKDGAVISQKVVRLHMSNVSRYDLFKRMQSIEMEYMQASASERGAIVTNEMNPLSSLWSGG